MVNNKNQDPSLESRVAQLFGLYRAEWLNGQLFDLFAEPGYYNELKTPRPCVLIGGRGTGKTTVLRGMSYEGQYALGGCKPEAIDEWSYIGIYHRVNTNRVMAFMGPELAEQQWVRCFGHYVNLVLCGHLIDFVLWFSATTQRGVRLTSRSVRRIQQSLHLDSCHQLSDLAEALDDARLTFEAAINNVADEVPGNLSMQGAPVDELAGALIALPEFKGKQFFFLIDEYENLQDYQQQVVNTLIKHAPSTYTFKIGVRELGWRIRATLNVAEQLRHPADYARINIHEEFRDKRFAAFAERVCNERLGRAVSEPPPETLASRPNVRAMLPGLSLDQEAELLGVEEHNVRTLKELEDDGAPGELAFAKLMSPAHLYLVRYLAEAGGHPVRKVVAEAMAKPRSWENRYNNYMHAALFTVRRNKAGIRKYYAGWEVLARIADGNIRYVLELVHKSLLNHFESGSDLSRPVSPKEQTAAAQQVGKRNLSELEGITVEGGRLTKLLLSLGRIFQVLAETPSGHAPEVNQFYLDDNSAVELESTKTIDVDHLLRSAVMHLALVRSPGNKLLDEYDTREYDYMVHPVFAPFFGFSHRRKRKLKLTASQLLGLIENPRATIREVLETNNRIDTDELPDQLRLFGGYYSGGA